MRKTGISAGLATILMAALALFFAPSAAAAVTCSPGTNCTVNFPAGTFTPNAPVTGLSTSGILGPFLDVGAAAQGPGPAHPAVSDSDGETIFAPLYDGDNDVTFAQTGLTADSDGSLSIIVPVEADAPAGDCGSVIVTAGSTASAEVCTPAASSTASGTLAFTGGSGTARLVSVGAVLCVAGAGVALAVRSRRRVRSAD